MDFSNEIKNVIDIVEKQQQQDSNLKVVSEVSYNEGEPIVHRHQLDKDMYYISSGEARVRLPGRRTREIRLASGEVLGELSFLMGEERSATVEAIRPTICKRLHSETLRKWLEEHPVVATRFYRSLSETIAKRLRNSGSKGSGGVGETTELKELLERRFSSFYDDVHVLCDKSRAKIETISSKYQALIRENEAEFQLKKDTLSLDLQKKQRLELETLRRELNSQMAEEKSMILLALQPKLQEIFNQIEQILYGVEDLYDRQFFGSVARKAFSEIFSNVTLFRIIEESRGIETVDLITHIMQYRNLSLRERSLDEIEAIFEEVIGGWPTFEAYRTRYDLLNQCFDKEPYSNAKCVGIFNDLTGALFSRIYPMVARGGGHIYVYSDLRDTFSYTEFALDMRSDTVEYDCEYIPNFEVLIKSEHELITKDCDVIVVHGILDYLPDDIAYRLFSKIAQSLKDGGHLLVTGLTTTSDEILVSDFLGLTMIRRHKEDFVSLFDSNIFSVVTYQEQDNGVLLSIRK